MFSRCFAITRLRNLTARTFLSLLPTIRIIKWSLKPSSTHSSLNSFQVQCYDSAFKLISNISPRNAARTIHVCLKTSYKVLTKSHQSLVIEHVHVFFDVLTSGKIFAQSCVLPADITDNGANNVCVQSYVFLVARVAKRRTRCESDYCDLFSWQMNVRDFKKYWYVLVATKYRWWMGNSRR